MVEEKIEGEIKLRYTDDDIVSESKATAKAIGAMSDSIESDLDDIGDNADKVQKEFEGVGKSAKSGGDKASKALDTTGEKAKKAAGKLKETGTAGKKAGDDVAAGANKGGRAMDQMATSANNADNSMETLSTSMIGLAQTATGVSDAIFGLSASLVGLEKTKFGIKGMEIAIRIMEEDLITAIESGTLSILEQERAAEQLTLAHEGLSLEVKQAAADELALNGQLITLAINTGAAIVQSVIMIKTLTTMIGVRAAVTASTSTNTVATGVNTGSTTINTATTTGNTTGIIAKTGATIASTVATVASTIATRAMTTAMLLSPLAPFAIAAIAAGAAFIALNDNIGGVRDSIEDLTGAERGSIPTLGFSITGLGEEISNTNESMNEFEQITHDSLAGTKLLTVSVGELADEFTIFTSTLQTFESQIAGAGVMALNEDMDSLISSVKTAADNMDEFPERVNLAMDAIAPSIQNTAKQFDLAWGEGAFRKRLIEMKRFGEITREEFNLIAQSVDLTSTKIDNLIKKNDDLDTIQDKVEDITEQVETFILRANQFFSAGGTLNTLTQASGIPTIQGLVTQAFFDALPPGTEGGFTPTSGPGIPLITIQKQAQATALKNSVEGILIVALRGGSLDRTQSKIAQSLPSGFFADIFAAKKAGLFPFSPTQFLQEGGTYGELNEIAIQVIEGEALRLAVEAAAVIASRAESVELLSTRLGVSQEDITRFTQTEAGLAGFIDPVLAANLGFTEQQIQDFLSTEAGRNDLANLIGWAQREELLRNLV